MIVYGSTISPFVRKVVAFAAEKGLDVEVRRAGMGSGGAEFDEASPFGKIPAFRDPGADGGADFTISDSTAICAYLDAQHPEPNLIPAAPVPRPRAVWFEEFADTVLGAAGGKLFFNRLVSPLFLKRPGDEAVAAAAERDELPPILDYVERVAPDDFLLEGRLTIADIAVASPFANLLFLGFAFDRWPRTQAYVDRILARPSFAAMVEKDRQLFERLR